MLACIFYCLYTPRARVHVIRFIMLLHCLFSFFFSAFFVFFSSPPFRYIIIYMYLYTKINTRVDPNYGGGIFFSRSSFQRTMSFGREKKISFRPLRGRCARGYRGRGRAFTDTVIIVTSVYIIFFWEHELD